MNNPELSAHIISLLLMSWVCLFVTIPGMMLAASTETFNRVRARTIFGNEFLLLVLVTFVSLLAWLLAVIQSSPSFVLNTLLQMPVAHHVYGWILPLVVAINFAAPLVVAQLLITKRIPKPIMLGHRSAT